MTDSPEETTVRVAVGRITRAHGVHGEVGVQVRTDDPDRRFAAGAVLTTDTGVTLTVQRTRWHSGRLLVRFAGIDDRTAAEDLRGRVLFAEVDERVRPEDPEEYYDYQLIGMRVETVTGQEIGVVREVLHLPGQDVLAIERSADGEAFVPFVAALVPEVDVDQRRLRIDPPPGLLEL
ncbi:MAG: ribosome maturation factor RimM [Acidothermus cellulolyticus]|nr:ribosome maturation factor RimM [Acidothermus cellulolyticus]